MYNQIITKGLTMLAPGREEVDQDGVVLVDSGAELFDVEVGEIDDGVGRRWSHQPIQDNTLQHEGDKLHYSGLYHSVLLSQTIDHRFLSAIAIAIELSLEVIAF